MRELTKVIRAKVGKFSELTQEEQLLLYTCVKARLNAQAPYSNYLVGAAVMSKSGNVYEGCNVERCTLTQTTHAEQNAIDNMVAKEGPTAKVKIVAVVSGPKGIDICFSPSNTNQLLSDIKDILAPCGHCLQIIWENCFGDSDVKLISLTRNGEAVSTTIGDAFPMRFGPGEYLLNNRD